MSNKTAKKTEVMRTTKEETRIITLLREIDIDKLIGDIDIAMHISEKPLETLQLMRSVLKSEFIPPLESLDSRTLTPEYKKLLTNAFENKTPIILIGTHDNSRITLVKSILTYYKYLLKKVVLVDRGKDLVNSASLVGPILSNISGMYLDYSLLYNLYQENIDRLIINNPRNIEDYLLLDLMTGYKLPFFWISDIHPLDAEILKSSPRAYTLAKTSLENTEYLLITCLTGDNKYSIELIQP